MKKLAWNLSVTAQTRKMAEELAKENMRHPSAEIAVIVKEAWERLKLEQKQKGQSKNNLQTLVDAHKR